MESHKKEGGIVQLVLVLGIITFVCALLLGMANGITAPRIELNEEETRSEAMAEIIEGAEFEDMGIQVSAEQVAADLEQSGVSLPAGRTPAAISGVYHATVDGSDAGYCFEVQPKGFGGTLTLIVGIGSDGTVEGAKVTSHAETPGLGAKSQTDEEWITQFSGEPANGQLAVGKDGGSIDAITGATITSRAVTDGVNTAAAYTAVIGVG